MHKDEKIVVGRNVVQKFLKNELHENVLFHLIFLLKKCIYCTALLLWKLSNTIDNDVTF